MPASGWTGQLCFNCCSFIKLKNEFSSSTEHWCHLHQRWSPWSALSPLCFCSSLNPIQNHSLAAVARRASYGQTQRLSVVDVPSDMEGRPLWRSSTAMRAACVILLKTLTVHVCAGLVFAAVLLRKQKRKWEHPTDKQADRLSAAWLWSFQKHVLDP